MTNRINLNREGLFKINSVLHKFPDAKRISLEYNGSSGIGYTLDLIIDHEHNGVKGEFKTQIVGVESW